MRKMIIFVLIASLLVAGAFAIIEKESENFFQDSSDFLEDSNFEKDYDNSAPCGEGQGGGGGPPIPG